MLIGLALLVLVPAAREPALAQGSGSQSTDLQLELKRKRSVVPRPSDTGQAVKDADAAARQLDEQRRADEMRTRAMRPPSPSLDESVVEGRRSRQLQEGPKH